MLITRETDYALRILRYLADGMKHTMKALCEEECIPQQFAYKIIKKLSDAGIVESTRGVNGGCTLCYDLHTLTLYDLIHSIDDTRYISACMEPGYLCNWQERSRMGCNLHYHISQVQATLDEELRKHTIYDMLFVA